MSTLHEELQDYFEHFDGTNHNWDKRVHAEVEQLYHPDLTVVTSDGPKDRAAMINFVKDFTEEGGRATDIVIEDLEDGRVHYRVRLVHGSDGAISLVDSIGTYKEGKLIRIEPADPSVYTKMMAKQ